MKNMKSNYAFIDSQNLNLGVRSSGWRLDYNFASYPMKDKLTRAVILKEAMHSDHCPALLEFKV